MCRRLPCASCIWRRCSVVLHLQVGVAHCNSWSLHWAHSLCSLVDLSHIVSTMSKEYYLIVEVGGGQKILLSRGTSIYKELAKVFAWKNLFEGKYYVCHKDKSGYVCDKSCWAPSRKGKVEFTRHSGEIIVHAEDEAEREVLIPVEDSYLRSEYILSVINEHVANASLEWERVTKVFDGGADTRPGAKQVLSAAGHVKLMEHALKSLPVLMGAYYRVKEAEDVRRESALVVQDDAEVPESKELTTESTSNPET